MCGICGIYNSEHGEPLGVVVKRMVRTIVHRGPDAEGVFTDTGIALGHRRLEIIDLSPAGAQPMTVGSTTVVYNGESYNFRELRAELEAAGCKFRGHSDTEVLVQAYNEWGLDGLSRLEGMFAFGLWDAARRRLVLMRDRFGIKPLFYAWEKGRLAFGSEIKAVLAGAEIDRNVDDQALVEYLWYGNAFEERTMFRSVRALQPGHRLIVEDGKIEIEPWWKIEEWLAHPAKYTDPQDAAVAVRVALDVAVERQLVADVPVCVFLSGGVDSSSIAATAAIASGQKLASYAVGFDFEGGVNELPKAQRVADFLDLDHHELQVSGHSLVDTIEALVVSHDEPFADAANIPLYLLAKELNGSVKVALQGDGGDEMFAGYRRYGILRHAAAWKLWPHVLERLLRLIPSDKSARLARIGAAVGNYDPALRMALLLTMETLPDPPTAMLSAESRQRLEGQTDPFAAYRRCSHRFSGEDAVQQMLLTDITLQLPSQFLSKVDRATMAHGIEARVPLLDERIASLAVGLPAAFKIASRQKKLVLRESMRARLPADILDGPKTGFGVPYGEWIRGALYEFARSAILDRTFADRFGMDRNSMETALKEHHSRSRERGFLLWKLLQLSLWSRKYLH